MKISSISEVEIWRYKQKMHTKNIVILNINFFQDKT
jgi:hypothetical protein